MGFFCATTDTSLKPAVSVGTYAFSRPFKNSNEHLSTSYKLLTLPNDAVELLRGSVEVLPCIGQRTRDSTVKIVQPSVRLGLPTAC